MRPFVSMFYIQCRVTKTIWSVVIVDANMLTVMWLGWSILGRWSLIVWLLWWWSLSVWLLWRWSLSVWLKCKEHFINSHPKRFFGYTFNKNAKTRPFEWYECIHVEKCLELCDKSGFNKKTQIHLRLTLP